MEIGDILMRMFDMYISCLTAPIVYVPSIGAGWVVRRFGLLAIVIFLISAVAVAYGMFNYINHIDMHNVFFVVSGAIILNIFASATLAVPAFVLQLATRRAINRDGTPSGD
jgi:hypothetical protein